MMIHAKMIAIMRDAPVISKDSKNTTQGFMFRGVDAVYNRLHELLAKHGVYTTSEIIGDVHEERHTKSGGALIYRLYKIRYTFHAEDGSSVSTEVAGEAMDSGDKASIKAFSVAHKYAFFQCFTIPTAEMIDPDSESHEVVSQKQPAKPERKDVF